MELKTSVYTTDFVHDYTMDESYNPNDPYDTRPDPSMPEHEGDDFQPDEDIDGEAQAPDQATKDVVGDGQVPEASDEDINGEAQSPDQAAEPSDPEGVDQGLDEQAAETAPETSGIDEAAILAGPPQNIPLHPMTDDPTAVLPAQAYDPAATAFVVPAVTAEAEEIVDWSRPAAATYEPDVAYDPYDESPARRGVPIWALLLIVLLALAAGAAAGLAFPEVRGATKGQLQDQRAKTSFEQAAAADAAKELKAEKAKNADLQAANDKLTTEKDKLSQTSQQAKSEQTQLAAAQGQLTTSSGTLHDTLVKLQTTSQDPASAVIPSVNALNAQGAVSSAAMLQQLTRLSKLDATKQRQGIKLVDGAVQQEDQLLDAANTALALCTQPEKKQPCRAIAVGKYPSQLVAIDQKLAADITKLLASAPAASSATAENPQAAPADPATNSATNAPYTGNDL